ncbi:unnamed protein product [Cuscuta epithymum]|uniref:BAG domain-containing protein n=1 Tax=Cuscuta epithymum TaxID=186058 RepID=A0AAV0FYT6_9ASTE|nr:unnamed protein product [Cuscuta epithymum]
MDSYPYHKNQIPTFPYSYYYPNGQMPARPDMNVDPGKFYGSWPLGGYPYPVPHGGCCHSSNFQQPSSCALRPPYPHIAPHPSHYAPPGPYPFHYAPPPYFSMEQPHYGFPNNYPTDHHCCGCPNHPCKKNETKDLKIEEHDENVDRKTGEAMVPFNAWSHPYPVGWFPYGDVRREYPKEQGKAYSGWSPLNYMQNSEGMKDGEDLRLTTPHKQDGKSMPFPYPIVWMPDQPKDNPKIGRKVIDLGPKSSSDQELLPLLEPNPKGSLDDEGKAFSSGVEEKKTVNKGVSFPKVIPVKQLEDHNDMKSPSNQMEGNSAHATMKPKNETEDKKLIKENGPKQQGSSSKKPSKLPPVCLRVDPFPRKKGHNKPHDKPKDKHHAPLNGVGNSECEGSCGVSNKVEGSKCSTETFNVNIEETTQGEDTKKEVVVGCAVPTGESESQIGSVGVEKVAPSEQEKRTCPGKVVLCDKTKGQTETLTKTELSESEAATKIQSAYRGFEVRKWETLKKLKQISSFREKVLELRTHIQALEDSSDKPVDDKQKNVIAETIMNLLLKLDAIQGLHPSVREVRKSVTRELVSLQEKLDSLIDRSPQPQATTKHHSTAENAISVDGSATSVDGNATVIQGHPNNTMEQCEEGELPPLPLENLHDLVPNDGQENGDQIDDVFVVETQPTSMELLESKEMLDLDQCPSSTNYDVEKTDGSCLEVLSQEEQQKGLNESCLFKNQVKETAQVPPLDNILNGVEHEEEVEAQTDQETGICSQTSEATKGDSDGPPQDGASLVEAEHFDRKLEDDQKKQQVQDENVELKSGGETAPKVAEEAVVNENVAAAEVACWAAPSDQEGDRKHVMEDNGKLDRGMEGDDQKKQQVQDENVELKSGGETTAKEEADVNETAAVAEVAGWSACSDQEGDRKHVMDDNGKLDREMEDDDQKQQQVQDENVELKSSEEMDAEGGGAGEAAVKATAAAADNRAYSDLEGDGKLVMEENEKLRKLMEGLVESGKEQLTTISALSARMNQLEKMLSSSRRKKLKMRKHKSRALPDMDSSEVV